jgi:hypothetical protein
MGEWFPQDSFELPASASSLIDDEGAGRLSP